MWRVWALWGDSWPGSSCVSPGSRPVRCTSFSRSKHFILAWRILRPRWLLHSLPQMQLILVVSPFAWVDNIWSVRLEISSSPPPLDISWGYFSLGLSIAFFGFFVTKDTEWGANPFCPRCRLSVLSTVSPVVTICSWLSPSPFLGVTGNYRLQYARNIPWMHWDASSVIIIII